MLGKHLFRFSPLLGKLESASSRESSIMLDFATKFIIPFEILLVQIECITIARL